MILKSRQFVVYLQAIFEHKQITNKTYERYIT